MLEKVNLKKYTTKQEYKPESERLKLALSVLQQRVKAEKLPVIILFEGWGAAGKGSRISDVILNLDPRGFKVYSTVAADEAERRKPLLWRYWNEIPAYGEMSIFDRSWYQEASIAQLEEGLSHEDAVCRMRSINTFERQLCDDGYLILKFFLHISQKEQRERLEELEESKATSWRVTNLDWKRNKQYPEYYKVLDDMLERTNTSYAPWHVIGSHDKYSAQLEIFGTIVDTITETLDARKAQKENPASKPASPIIVPDPFCLVDVPSLSEINLEKFIGPEEYKEELKKQQKVLNRLHNQLYRKKVPVVIVYEGWDAAGKGGNIRRVAAALDPRGYEVVPIAAPDKYELNHHYLWRFWKNLPKTGHIAIFDRSWYGRVMVERIEGFCPKEAWLRAYQEINEFEEELDRFGAVIVKFWLHVDKDEQLRRFEDRQNTPEKQWKITEEDWRNREKWDQYEVAVNDMLKYTSTRFAPWTIIESNDKKFGRIKAIKTLINAIEEKLD